VAPESRFSERSLKVPIPLVVPSSSTIFCRDWPNRPPAPACRSVHPKRDLLNSSSDACSALTESTRGWPQRNVFHVYLRSRENVSSFGRNPSRPSRKDQAAETLHLLPRGWKRVLRSLIFSPMARPGPSEAVDALFGIPERTCFRTLREHETTSRYPMETTLRRRPTEARPVVSKNDFERHPLKHPLSVREDRDVRLIQTPHEEGDDRNTTRRNPREHRAFVRRNTIGRLRTRQRKKTLKPGRPRMTNGRRVGILRGMAAGEGKASKGDASWKERCLFDREVEDSRAATR